MIKTSISHPLLIPSVSPGAGMGKIGFVFCPGRKGTGLTSGTWDRDLKTDLAAIQGWGASAVVSLTEQHELAKVQAQDIGKETDQMHMDWFHLPIQDVSVPDERFLTSWPKVGPDLRDRLRSGNNVLLHCMGGLGRSGMVAALLMVELGNHPNRAIEAVRKAHKDLLGSHHSQPIETQAQEAFVKKAKPIPELQPSQSAEATRDRAIGAMMGLAVGDALGTTLEFATRDDTAPKLTDMVGGGPFRLKPGQWTDDTAMAIALGYSLRYCGKLDEQDLLTRFVSWWRKGTYACTGSCFDIGTTTRSSLDAWVRTKAIPPGATDSKAAGNGSLMRLAPVAIRYWDAPDTRRDAARRQSLTTHAAPEAVDACVLFGDILADAIAGKPKSEVLAPRNGRFAGRIADIARGGWRQKKRSEIRGSGYVVDALEAALWCVAQTSDYRGAVLMAANLRQDADTTAAIAGQLAGALYGGDSIPEEWKQNLSWAPEITDLANAIFSPIRCEFRSIIAIEQIAVFANSWNAIPIGHENWDYWKYVHRGFIEAFHHFIHDGWYFEPRSDKRWERECSSKKLLLPENFDEFSVNEMRDFFTYSWRTAHCVEEMAQIGAIQKALLIFCDLVTRGHEKWRGPI